MFCVVLFSSLIGVLQRRTGSRWQKKWVVLTENSLAYYGSKGDSVPKMLVLLETTVIERLAGGELGFSVTNNCLYNPKHAGNSQEKSVEFQSASEQNLTEWLYPLAALAGIKEGEAKTALVTEICSKAGVSTTIQDQNQHKEHEEVVYLEGYLKKVCLIKSCLFSLLS